MSTRRAERLTVRGWLTQVVAWFVIAAVVVVLAACVVVPQVAGATPYTILTGSMRPGMAPGTLVVVKPVDADRIAIGTVITYQLRSGDPTVVTHRVVAQGVKDDSTPIFRTQGDANDVPDPVWVRPVQIKGERWYAIPYLGHVSAAISGSQRRTATVVVGVGLLGYAAAMFVGAARSRHPASSPSRHREEVMS